MMLSPADSRSVRNWMVCHMTADENPSITVAMIAMRQSATRRRTRNANAATKDSEINNDSTRVDRTAAVHTRSKPAASEAGGDLRQRHDIEHAERVQKPHPGFGQHHMEMAGMVEEILRFPVVQQETLIAPS